MNLQKLINAVHYFGQGAGQHLFILDGIPHMVAVNS